MSDTRTSAWTSPRPATAAPMGILPYEALAGVRRRRIMAVLLDLILVGIIACMIGFALVILTFGLSLFFLPPLFPIVAFFYNGLTVSGPRMGTPGMRAMDLEARLSDGSRVPFLNAAVHAILFYVSWMFPLVFLFSLVSSEKRCLHDIFSGIIIVRRAD